MGGADADERLARFLCTQAVLLALQGIPALYFGSLLAAPNDAAGAEQSGRSRSLNRHKWQAEELAALLRDPAAPAARALAALLQLLRARAAQPSFAPSAPQAVRELDPRLFALERGEGPLRVLAVHNLSADTVPLPAIAQGRDLLADAPVPGGAALPPWGFRWIALA